MLHSMAVGMSRFVRAPRHGRVVDTFRRPTPLDMGEARFPGQRLFLRGPRVGRIVQRAVGLFFERRGFGVRHLLSRAARSGRLIGATEYVLAASDAPGTIRVLYQRPPTLPVAEASAPLEIRAAPRPQMEQRAGPEPVLRRPAKPRRIPAVLTLRYGSRFERRSA